MKQEKTVKGIFMNYDRSVHLRRNSSICLLAGDGNGDGDIGGNGDGDGDGDGDSDGDSAGETRLG